ncbi:unnamed protein product [Pieris brassicae]|uniref:Uncharacterized protein n=1 Tax=Pieris brassicae TaxID=7116 RepID=A0A9P0SQ80_PIEBR|nr:unnamed protein product [Pieris brassicae]
MGMWARRYQSGSLYVHIEDGWRVFAARIRGEGDMNAAPRLNPPPPCRNGRDHAAPSDDKNAIIMAPEYFLLHRSKYPLRIQYVITRRSSPFY